MPSPVRDASLALGSMFSILLLTGIIWLLMPSLRGMGTGPMDNLPQAALILLPIALVIAGQASGLVNVKSLLGIFLVLLRHAVEAMALPAAAWLALVLATGAGAYILLQRRFLQLEFTVKAKPRQTFSDV